MIRSTARLIALAVLTISLGACASSHRAATPAPGMVEGDQVVTFQVEGMACRNCAREIAHELEVLPGVRAAVIDFDTKTATVALTPTKGSTMEELHAAVEHWRVEHFGAKDDPNCLDPAKRAALQQQMQAE